MLFSNSKVWRLSKKHFVIINYLLLIFFPLFYVGRLQIAILCSKSKKMMENMINCSSETSTKVYVYSIRIMLHVETINSDNFMEWQFEDWFKLKWSSPKWCYVKYIARTKLDSNYLQYLALNCSPKLIHWWPPWLIISPANTVLHLMVGRVADWVFCKDAIIIATLYLNPEALPLNTNL